MTEAFTATMLTPVLPELVLAAGALVLLMIGAFAGHRSLAVINTLSLLLIAAVAAMVVTMAPGKHVAFGGSFIVDDFARFLKILALATSASAIVLSFDYLRAEKQQKFEYPVLILLSTVGMMMLISANDLIALYLGLELMSLALYVIAASNRDSVRSTKDAVQ
jgi:NADH-quinone oxidoreductase subunit N